MAPEQQQSTDESAQRERNKALVVGGLCTLGAVAAAKAVDRLTSDTYDDRDEDDDMVTVPIESP